MPYLYGILIGGFIAGRAGICWPGPHLPAGPASAGGLVLQVQPAHRADVAGALQQDLTAPVDWHVGTMSRICLPLGCGPTVPRVEAVATPHAPRMHTVKVGGRPYWDRLVLVVLLRARRAQLAARRWRMMRPSFRPGARRCHSLQDWRRAAPPPSRRSACGAPITLQQPQAAAARGQQVVATTSREAVGQWCLEVC